MTDPVEHPSLPEVIRAAIAAYNNHDAAEALEAEARRRVDAGTFFGHIAYASLLATRPADTRR